MKNTLVNLIKSSAMGGVTLMGLTLLSQPAQAVIIKVNSIDYDVQTFTGSYNANTSKFATAANGGSMPWWGDSTLAGQFALAIYNLTPTNGGLAGNPVYGYGPLFASSTPTISDPEIGLRTVIRSSAVSMSEAFTGSPVGQIDSFLHGTDSTFTYATATVVPTAVPWETDVLPVIGSTLLFAGGVWRKRKLAKPLNKD